MILMDFCKNTLILDNYYTIDFGNIGHVMLRLNYRVCQNSKKVWQAKCKQCSEKMEYRKIM